MKRFVILTAIIAALFSSTLVRAQVYVKLNTTLDWRYLPGKTVSTPTFGLGTGFDLIVAQKIVIGAAFDISARYERSNFYRYKPAPMSPYWFYLLSGKAGYRIRLNTTLPIDLTPHAGAGLYMEPGTEQGKSCNTIMAYAGTESDIMLTKHMALRARLQIIATPEGRIGFNAGCGLSFLL